MLQGVKRSKWDKRDEHLNDFFIPFLYFFAFIFKSAVSVFVFNFSLFWFILTNSTNRNSYAKLSYILLIVYVV